MGGFKPHGHFPRWAGEALRGWKTALRNGPAEADPQASPIKETVHKYLILSRSAKMRTR